MEKESLIFLKLKGLDIDLVKSSVSQDKDGKIVSYIVLNDHNIPCPNCGMYDCVIQKYYTRKITHSISTDAPSIIYYKARRYKCKGCGHLFYEPNPFVQKSNKISTYTELIILDKLKYQNSTYSSVAKDLNISTTSVISTFDKHVKAETQPYSEVISIDEIYTRNLTNRKYCCVIYDFIHRQLIDVFPSRLKYELNDYFMFVPKKVRETVKYVIIDMWETYKQVAHDVFPNCSVAVDSFHVMQHLNKAVDDIRLKVMRKYDRGHSRLAQAEMYYYMLKKYADILTSDFEKYPDYKKIYKYNYTWPKEAIREYLLDIDEELREAYYLKEKYKESLEKDLKTKTTNIGIHKEDFLINLDGKNIAYYGSQGENRIGILALKLAPYFLLSDYKVKPLVILDDVLSELDEIHENLLINFLKTLDQVFITGTRLNNKLSKTNYLLK